MEEHVKTFEFMLKLGKKSLLDVNQPDVQKALRAAIDLMNAAKPGATFEQAWAATGRQYGEDALEQVHLGWELGRASVICEAQPLDEAAERERISSLVTRYTEGEGEFGFPSLHNILEEACAQARAEGYAQGTERLFESENARSALTERVNNLTAQLSAAKTKLSAAQADLEQCKRFHTNEYIDRTEAETKLSAAQAKIERSQEMFVGQSTRAGLLETKLKNLRTAAERYGALIFKDSSDTNKFREEIEASR